MTRVRSWLLNTFGLEALVHSLAVADLGVRLFAPQPIGLPHLEHTVPRVRR